LMPKAERVFPGDPLEFIKTRVKERKIKWTYHVNMRMKDRFISREFIINSADSFQVIEEYPTINIFQVILFIPNIKPGPFIFCLLLMYREIM